MIFINTSECVLVTLRKRHIIAPAGLGLAFDAMLAEKTTPPIEIKVVGAGWLVGGT
jgi:hypothetical protein